MQDILNAVLIVEAGIIGLFVLLLVVGNIAEWVETKLNPRYPHCDIDPRCHVAFVWDKDGNGWIGEHLVVPVQSD